MRIYVLGEGIHMKLSDTIFGDCLSSVMWKLKLPLFLLFPKEQNQGRGVVADDHDDVQVSIPLLNLCTRKTDILPEIIFKRIILYK